LSNAEFPHHLSILQGFDEYMNLVLEDAEEINIKKDTRKSLG
jgi:small nuclear ribonucleoprotein E